jgi:hypothetical protein
MLPQVNWRTTRNPSSYSEPGMPPVTAERELQPVPNGRERA